MVMPTFNWLEIHVISEEEDLWKIVNGMESARCLCVTNRIEHTNVPRILPMTCVSVVKSLIGVRCMSITPKGLYRFLSKRGQSWQQPQQPQQQQ